MTFKNVRLCIAATMALMAVVCAQAQTQPFSFNGISPGGKMPAWDGMGCINNMCIYGGMLSCATLSATCKQRLNWAGIQAREVAFILSNARIVALRISFQSDDYQKLVSAANGAYGEPSEQSRPDANGASGVGRTAAWIKDNAFLLVQEYGESTSVGVATIQKYDVTVTGRSLKEQAQDQEAEAVRSCCETP
jgi:hypothetical protein